MKKTFKRVLALVLALTMAVGMTVTVALAEEQPGTTEVVVDRIVTSTEDNLSSFSGGGWTAEDDDYAFVSALFVNGGKIDERSVTQAIQGGKYDEKEADGVKIVSKAEGFNPIIVHDSEYVIKNAEIIIDSNGDGTVTNDFSGYGAAIATYGDSTIVTLEDSKVWVGGVANLAVFTDDGSDIVIKNTELHSDGGTLYESYRNSPDQTTMVAPPWILGIMGSSRCTNLMGNNSSMTVIESETTAAQWAILSTDSGQKMTLTVINSYMGLTGADYDLQVGDWFGTGAGKDENPYSSKAGYGTYTIGNSNQKFYGVDMEVGTYANIYTGGQGLYTAMTAGEAIDYLDANGNVVGTYVPTESKVTHIKSDTFGFMAHQGTDTLTIEKGTIVDSGYTFLLHKTGCSMDLTVDNSVINPGNGILIQILDNDDSTTGMDVSTFSFYTTHTENAGWPTVGATASGNASTYTFANGEYTGDIFNGSGWELNSTGAQTAIEATVVLENGAALTGQISSTAAIHVTKEGSDAVKAAPAGQKASDEWVQYQNTEFTMSEYYDIGQVANRIQSHGLNSIDLVIDETSSWTVTGDGILRNVTANSASIKGTGTITIEGTLTLDGEVVTETTTVNGVTFEMASKEVEVEALDVSGWVIGQIYNGQGEVVSGAGAITVEGTDATCKVIDGDANGEMSEGDAVLQYEAGTMLGWLDAEGKLTTTYPLAGEGGMGGMGGGPGGPGGPGGGPGGPGMGGGSGEPVVLGGKIVVTLAEDGTVLTAAPDYDYVAPETDGSELEPVVLGSFCSGRNGPAAAPRYASVLNQNGKVEINDSVSWHNGVIFSEAGTWTMSGSVIMKSDADGSDTNDFSGLGAAVMVVGQGVTGIIEDAVIDVAGVGKLALFTDSGAVSIVKNSSLYAYGGTIYDGYMSTADQAVMVSPPWVLGLGGNAENPCNSRTTNLMGDYSVAAYVDSYFYAKGWGALSVDSGTNMNMVIVNSKVDVETSGYGAYNIGNSTETYYGSAMDVSTYAIIMTGGEATFQSYTGGQKVDVVQFAGETNEYGHGIKGNVVATVASDKVAEGEKVLSSIVSDDFGFMCHNNGSDAWNVVNVLDGTSVKTGDAIFLVKKVSAVFNVDNAVLESGNKTIVQIIDNDDDYVGVNPAAEWGHDNGYGHAYGTHMPTFNELFTEKAGYSNEWATNTTVTNPAYDPTQPYATEPVLDENGEPVMGNGPFGPSAMTQVVGNWSVDYNMTNTSAEGDLWNSTGYVGSNPATTLNVNLGEGAELKGIISAGAFSHTTKEATVGNGDWTGADALGHVTNIVNSNGVNLVNVTLTADATWTLTGDAHIDTLSVKDNASVVVPAGVTLTVGDTTYTGVTITASGAAETGDTSIALYAVLAAIATVSLAGVVVLKKKEQF